MRKNLLRDADFYEVSARIQNLRQDLKPAWGRMDAAQMCRHCETVLQVVLGNIILPKQNILIRSIGIVTKYEMELFNNGIPPNMPTFSQVKISVPCSFTESKDALLRTLEQFKSLGERDALIKRHSLFGKMNSFDHGFLQYKHLNHHLKQFHV